MTVADILNLLDDHGFSDTSTTDKGLAINAAYHDICAREAWPFLETTVDLDTDATNQLKSNAAALTDIREVKAIVNLSTGQVLLPERAEVVYKKFAGYLSQSDDPLLYYFINSTMYVYPTPGSSASGVFRMLYLKREPDLTAAGTATTYTGSDNEAAILIPKQHHRAIVDGALAYLYRMEDDPELAVPAQAAFEAKIQDMKDDIFSRSAADRPDRIYVVDEDQDYDDGRF